MHLKIINKQWIIDCYNDQKIKTINETCKKIKQVDKIDKKKVLDCTKKGSSLDLYA